MGDITDGLKILSKDSDILLGFGAVLIILMGYFLSFQLQSSLARLLKGIEKGIGSFSTRREYSIQRYVYQHRGSMISKLYSWVNVQIISLGLKQVGVTPVGYIIFWGFISIILSIAVGLILDLNIAISLIFCIILFVCLLILTRVVVSERIEKREADVMDAIDLIVPEIHNGVKNAIIRYQDNFAISLRGEFKAFVTNIQDRGYTFNDAMYMLADQLGTVFYDFAQKAIFFESIGEPDMIDIFSDIVETNRLRRDLRDTNNIKFHNLKMSFIISSAMTFLYFLFIILTDEFSRNFFLNETSGKILLVVILLVVFGVLSFITTIKSRAI